jgi:hypothetical protein
MRVSGYLIIGKGISLLRKITNLILVFTCVVLSTPVLGSGYFGGSKGEEIILNGEVIFGGIGESWKSNVGEYVQQKPIVLIKYKGKLYRCHISLDIDLDIPQNKDGFGVHCWGRKQ